MKTMSNCAINSRFNLGMVGGIPADQLVKTKEQKESEKAEQDDDAFTVSTASLNLTNPTSEELALALVEKDDVLKNSVKVSENLVQFGSEDSPLKTLVIGA